MPQHQSNSPSKVVERLVRAGRLAVDLRRNGPFAGHGEPQIGPDADRPGPEGPATTVDATIRPVGVGRYRRLGWSPGEPHVLRDDLGAEPAEDRNRARRSLLYVAHHTDVHICDAQAPARMVGGDAFGWVNPGSDGGHRPQETCTTQVLDALVRATNAVAESPLSGAGMAWCIQTGDNTDNRTSAEVSWWLDVLNGGEVTPNTGLDGTYEGVQRSGWRTAWHPDRKAYDRRQAEGFPFLPGFLDGAVAPFRAHGLEVPWLAVFGNHDRIYQGSFGDQLRFPPLSALEGMLVGGARNPVSSWALIRAILHAHLLGDDPGRWDRFGLGPGVVQATADPEARRALPLTEYIARIIADDATGAGPTGHGFGPQNLIENTSWWSRPEGEHVQVIGLDTCHHSHGDAGRIGPRQLRWLEAELQRHHSSWFDPAGARVDGGGDDRLIILASHHSVETITNRHDDEYDPGDPAGGEDIVELVARYPNVVLWLNGHSHEHRITSHRRPGRGGGWWEVNTASAIDFGQQGRTIELFDNRDGTISIFSTVLDHLSDPRVPYGSGDGWTPGRLASLSRELAANDDRWFDPLDQLGGTGDRNVEIAVAAPFPLI